jgi:DNA-binding transcriptional ArsR family regulator
MLTQDLVLAGLKKIGPCSPGNLADHLEVEPAALGYHLKKLLDANAIKANGRSNARRIALPDQKFDEAATPPPQQRKQQKARKPKGGRKTRQHRTPHRAAERAQPAERFIPAVDAQQRLVIVNGGEPLVFTDEQTSAIADLLLQHYKA